MTTPEEKLSDGHPYVVIDPSLNFCGYYNTRYGHCGRPKEEHDLELSRTKEGKA